MNYLFPSTVSFFRFFHFFARWLAIFCMAAGGSHAIPAVATPFAIHSSKSYLSVDVLSWEKGLPWELTYTDPYTGQFFSDSGYHWMPTIRTERFSLSGHFNLTDWGSSLALTEVELFSSALDSVSFTLPERVAFNPENGAISKEGPPSCPSGWSCSIWTIPDYSQVAGSLVEDLLTLDGLNDTLLSSLVVIPVFFGGVEAPPGGILASSAVGYHLEAIAVPEPSSLLLVMSAGMALWYSRKRKAI